MVPVQPYIGIDFGTSKCTVSWYNPKSGQAEVIKNAEGEEQTPSAVYFGEEGDILVGVPAEHMLDEEVDPRRLVQSVKRNMVNAAPIFLPDRRVPVVQVAAHIIGKLKADAEELRFHGPVPRVVVTHPAAFDFLQQEEIEKAARMAGFDAVELVEEPVAAALAYAHTGMGAGNRLLVYDLGAGTFDVAVLEREEDTFQEVIPAQGIGRRGGNDFDHRLYEHLDEVAMRKLGQPLSGGEGMDPRLLRACRRLKESLSTRERGVYSVLLEDGTRFRHEVERATFEGLIEPYIEPTIRLTSLVLEEARRAGCEVDTVVLVGGSSRIPLVRRLLKAALPIEPKAWDQMDLAVGLGAAYHGHKLWGDEKVAVPVSPPLPDPAILYRHAVEKVWSDGTLNQQEHESLVGLQAELKLERGKALAIEQEVIGKTKEVIVRPSTLPGEEAPSHTSEIRTGRPARFLPLRTIQLPRPGVSICRSLAFSSDTAFLVAAIANPDQLQLCDLRSGQVMTEIRVPIASGSFALSPDGEMFAVSLDSGRTIQLRRTRTDAIQQMIHVQTSLKSLRTGSVSLASLAFNLACSGLVASHTDGTCTVWRIEDGARIWNWKTRSSSAKLAMTQTIVATVVDPAPGEIDLWKFDGQLFTTLMPQSASRGATVSAIAIEPQWSDDGSSVAVGYSNGTLTLWKTVINGVVWWSVRAHAENIESLVISPGGLFVVSRGKDEVKLWDMRNGDLLQVLVASDATRQPPSVGQGAAGFSDLGTVAVSPDGRIVAAGAGDTIQLWTLEVGTGMVRLAVSVVDHVTQTPIAGATVVVLPEGVRVADFDPKQVLATGTTDEDGLFVSEVPLQRGNSHTVLCTTRDYDVSFVDHVAVEAFQSELKLITVGLHREDTSRQR